MNPVLIGNLHTRAVQMYGIQLPVDDFLKESIQYDVLTNETAHSLLSSSHLKVLLQYELSGIK